MVMPVVSVPAARLPPMQSIWFSRLTFPSSSSFINLFMKQSALRFSFSTKSTFRYLASAFLTAGSMTVPAFLIPRA